MKYLLFLLSSHVALPVHANNSNIPPVAVLSSNPDGTSFYNAENVVFDYYDSYDEDQYINGTRWYINNVRIYSSDNDYTLSECFVLYENPQNGCYELANGVTTVSIKLGVRDVVGEWDYETKTYTIKEHKGRKYFIKDHLGSVRTTVNRDGNVLGYDDYYPFGLEMPGRSSNSANPSDNYKFTGYEKDDEAGLNMYHAGNRMYDPVLGRFMQIDRFYDKYPSLSTYQYTANNPVNFIDVNGDSINVAQIQAYDQIYGTDYLNTIMTDLSAMTGLQFSVTATGQLVYALDENGDAIVSTDKDGNTIGSGEARNRLKSAISVTDQVDVGISTRRGSFSNGSQIGLNPNQIDQFVNGTSSSLDSRTMGYGMTLMHEVLHSNVGMMAGDASSVGATGPVVDTMNRIRMDLGTGFGQRTSYPAVPMSNGTYLPFDQGSLRDIQRGILPAGSSMFIRFR